MIQATIAGQYWMISSSMVKVNINMESPHYIVAGVPSEELRAKLVRTSQLVAAADLAARGMAAVSFTLGMTAQGPHPHFSMMHISAEAGQLLEFCQRLGEVVGSHGGPIPVEAVRPGGRGAFANVLYNDANPRLRALRSDVHALATELGIGLAPEQADLLAELREQQQRGQLSHAAKKELSSLQQLGYKDWHATVTNVGTRLSPRQREVINRIMVPSGASVADFNGQVEAVAVYRLGECGTALGVPHTKVILSGS